MALPASLLAAIETHTCLSGCYSSQSDIQVCVDPGRPLAPTVHVSCADCLTFHAGTLASTLPAGTSSARLAELLGAHVRALRGYQWSVGGYHYNQQGMWLSAAGYACGVILIDSECNRRGQSDLDTLIEGIRHGVIPPQDPQMTDPALYRTHQVYLSMSRPIAPVTSVHDILGSPQCSRSHRLGFRAATVAEFLPMAASAAARAATSQPPRQPPPVVPVPPPNQAPLRLGDRCPVCGALVKERPSLYDTFIGCLC